MVIMMIYNQYSKLIALHLSTGEFRKNISKLFRVNTIDNVDYETDTELCRLVVLMTRKEAEFEHLM